MVGMIRGAGIAGAGEAVLVGGVTIVLMMILLNNRFVRNVLVGNQEQLCLALLSCKLKHLTEPEQQLLKPEKEFKCLARELSWLIVTDKLFTFRHKNTEAMCQEVTIPIRAVSIVRKPNVQ